MRSAHLDGWPWLGAPLAVDLANSIVQVRPGMTRDLLESDAQLDEWLDRECRRLPRVERGATRHAAFRELRDALHALLSAAARHEPLPRDSVAALNAAGARADGHLRLVAGRGEPAAEHVGSGSSLDLALSTIARSAVELLTGPERERLRVCHAPSCGMFFLGRAEQEWCSVPCGNRARAARHYAAHARRR